MRLKDEAVLCVREANRECEIKRSEVDSEMESPHEFNRSNIPLVQGRL